MAPRRLQRGEARIAAVDHRIETLVTAQRDHFDGCIDTHHGGGKALLLPGIGLQRGQRQPQGRRLQAIDLPLSVEQRLQ